MREKQCNIYCFALTSSPCDYSFFDIGSDKPYLAEHSQLFSQSPIYRTLTKNPSVRISCYFAGDYLANQPKKEIEAIQKLVDNKQIELLLGTYHHSLSCLLSAPLFKDEVENHRAALKELFNVDPTGFYNTIAIFSDDLIANLIKAGVAYTFAPAISWYLNDISSNVVSSKNSKLTLMLFGYEADPAYLIRHLNGQSDEAIQLTTVLAGEVIDQVEPEGTYSLPSPMGVDASHRNLDHFLGNTLQKQILKSLTDLALSVTKKGDDNLKIQLLKVSSPAVLDTIGSTNADRLTNYSSLVNILSDIELRVS